MRTHGFDRVPDRGALVTGEIVQDHDIPGVQGRGENLLDIGLKTRAVNRPVKDGWGGEATHAEAGHKGRGVPASIRGRIVDPDAPPTPTISAEQVGPHPALVQKDQPRRVERRRQLAPRGACSRDVSAVLFGRAHRFF